MMSIFCDSWFKPVTKIVQRSLNDWMDEFMGKSFLGGSSNFLKPSDITVCTFDSGVIYVMGSLPLNRGISGWEVDDITV